MILRFYNYCGLIKCYAYYVEGGIEVEWLMVSIYKFVYRSQNLNHSGHCLNQSTQVTVLCNLFTRK